MCPLRFLDALLAVIRSAGPLTNVVFRTAQVTEAGSRVVTRPRRRLRTRLLVAMVAIALGVLVLTALVTAGLARRSQVTTARHDVQNRAQVVGPEFDTLIKQLPVARGPPPPSRDGARSAASAIW